MGNSKLLIIVISVLSAVALICVGASARVFDDVDYYSYRGELNYLGAGYSSGISCYQFEVLDLDSNVVFSYGFDSEVIVFRNSFSHGNLLVPQFYYAVGTDVFPIYSSVSLSGSYDLVFYSTVDSSYSNFVQTSFVEPAGVSALPSSILSIGDSLVAFVMSSWVVLVPVVAFVFVLGISVIRRLTNGV